MAYYTPDSEEFCIGLECQVKYIDGWKDRKIRHGEDLCEIVSRYTTDKESVRVKVLDREDVESLLWVDLKTGGTKTFQEIKGFEKLEDGDWCEGILILRLRGNNISISFFNTNDPYSKEISQDIKRETLFAGKIKNKKEFQKLLAQLNI
jgi:hypothetical protein